MIVTLILSTIIIFLSYEISYDNEKYLPQSSDYDMSFPSKKVSSLFFQNHSPIVINGNSDFSEQADDEGWNGTRTPLNPYIIDGLNIIGDRSEDLINIRNTDVYFRVSSSIFLNGSNGLFFSMFQTISLRILQLLIINEVVLLLFLRIMSP